jgi:hypothetical protein
MHVFASFRQYLTETIFTMAYFKLALDSISYRQDFYNGIFHWLQTISPNRTFTKHVLLALDNIYQTEFYNGILDRIFQIELFQF